MRRNQKQEAVDLLAVHVSALGQRVEREHRFAQLRHKRQWRFDIAFPDIRVGVEVQGGVYVQGRHTRGAGVEADYEKFGAALELGWCVVLCTPRQVKSGQALRWVEAAIRLQLGRAA